VDPDVPLMRQPSAGHQATYIQGRFTAWVCLVLGVLFLVTAFVEVIL
jgi:hypothetical protein